MKQKCKVCGVNADSDLCFRHKPKKRLSAKRMKPVPLTSSVPPENTRMSNWIVMRTFFMSIWKTRPHVSEISPSFLGHEPLSVFFHHILPKEKYPQFRYDEENIILLTLDEHTNVEADMYKYEEINKRRQMLLVKHGL